MKYTLEFEIPVCPVAKERARVTRFGTYTPDRTREFERQVMMHARRNAPDGLIRIPIEVEIEFHLPKPKKPKFKVHAVRPDIDNFIKSIFDACNGIIWKDDALIWSVKAKKVYAVNEGKIVIKVSHD